MSAASSISRDEVGAILRCPRCRGTLSFQDTLLDCAACRLSFAMKPGSLPIYDLFIDEGAEHVGRDPRQVWKRPEFERNYEFTGYHESGVEFDRALGYPEEVSRFLFERVKKRMVKWVKPGAGHAILDVGCGAGYFLNLIRERYRQEGQEPLIVGIDISAHQVSYMAERMHKEGAPRVIAATANGEFLPFADEAFDLVTCSEVIEHIRNPKRALEEMRRILKPTGMLLLSTPSMSAQKGWSLILLPATALVKFVTRYKSKHSVPESYDVPWYAKEFRATVSSAGVRIHDFEYNAVIPHPYHFIFLPRPLVRPAVAFFGVVDRTLKWALKPLALHFVVRASRALAIILLGASLAASSTLVLLGPRAASAQESQGEQGDAWLNRNYFARRTDGFTQELLANAERNHLAQENFWSKYKSGELDRALGDLKYVLLVFPNHPRALHLMTLICRTMKDSTTPIVYFEKAVRTFPNEPYTFAQYGAYLISTGDTEQGIARLKDALRLNPNLTYALGLLAEAQKKPKAGTTPGAGTTGSTAPSGSKAPTPSAGPPTTTAGTPSTSTPGTTVR
ncbi:MAG TPA: methyltransferase domain-containing protein [Candidatus Eisenbacteria bacterium]|nr:methyltransferase domain-containing protein [Candidatus Eisenbacteria bacterium]